MISYFDTSAMVKLLVDEPGSERAASAWDSSEAIVSSVLLYPEARAAVAQARRTRRLTLRQRDFSVAALHDLMDAVALVVPDRTIAWNAGALAQRYDLRGYDAMHLASALSVGAETRFVTSDHRLAVAATQEGLTTFEPR